MFGIRKRRVRASEHERSQVVLQVAAILIALGAIMKLYLMRSQRADDRAFRRVRGEIDKLDITERGKGALKDVTDLASDLTRDARDEVSAASRS